MGGGPADLGGGPGQGLAGEGADVLERRLGEGGEVLGVEQAQLVGDLAAPDLDAAVGPFHLDQAGGQVPGHVAEDERPTGHHDAGRRPRDARETS